MPTVFQLDPASALYKELMRVLVIFVTLLLAWEGSVFAQETMQGAYQPPPTLEQSMMGDSPFAQEMMKAAYTGTLPEFRVYAEKQAVHGEVLAQLFLGTVYIPAECTYQPYKIAPEDCPSDLLQKNALGVTPSFDEAIHWLQLASGQGNGEASEILAEVMDRAIHSPLPTRWKESDVARYHALARSQGYDFQDVEISCYTLESSHAKEPLGMSSSTPAQFQFAPEVLGDLRSAGASGAIQWRGTSDQSRTVLFRHPEGPKVHIRVVLSGPIHHELFSPCQTGQIWCFCKPGTRSSRFLPPIPPASRPSSLSRPRRVVLAE